MSPRGTPRVFSFGHPGGHGSGIPPSPGVLGGKGAGLAVMSALRLPVPPGFTLATDVCAAYHASGHASGHAAGRTLPDGLQDEVGAALANLERAAGARLGDPNTPLLVSVRSGAPTSMPGMMDTVLNVGLNDVTVAGLARRTGDVSMAWDTYRRFLLSYADIILGLDLQPFEDLGDGTRNASARKAPGVPDWPRLTAEYLRLIAGQSAVPFPQDPMAQLWAAVRAVLDSWQGGRAVNHRRVYGLPDEPGTAVTVQAMVFGNAGLDSATGVGFTRDPSTGAPQPFGEYLPNAQGDDVVSGVVTPLALTAAAQGHGRGSGPSLEEAMPAVYAELLGHFRVLEARFGAMQDVEFTIERGKLWLLQTRNGTTSVTAAARIAVDMVAEGVLSRADAVARIDRAAVDRLLHPAVRADPQRRALARGLPASPGAATGRVVFSADEAVAVSGRKEPAVLVLTETHPRDIHGIHAAVAVLTSRGGATSHAAVVARGLGRPCVVGAGEVVVDVAAQRFTVRGFAVRQGDVITIDGGSGDVFLGAAALETPAISGPLGTLLSWAEEDRRLPPPLAGEG